MRSFWILLAAAVAGGATLIALGVAGEWWSSLLVFALVFSALKMYGLRSWWHAGLGMGLAALFLPPLSDEGRSAGGLAVMGSGIVLAVVSLYFMQRDQLRRSIGRERSI